MNSIAVWYEKINDPMGTTPELDIHINHWKLKFKKNFFLRKLRWLSSKTLGRFFERMYFNDSDYFMDVGLMVRDGVDVQNVCIYIPYQYTDQNKLIEDLGCMLENKRMITAVFNEPYNTATTANSKYFQVFKDGKQLFNVYKLDISNDILLSNSFDGTILKIPFKQFDNRPTYYRFRFKSPFVTNLSFFYKPSNKFLESAFSSIEIIDFRINDTRNLNVSLIEHINAHGHVHIALVHFFLMRSIKDEYIVSNQILNGVRQLEDETWSTYINQRQYVYKKSFAYHLKNKVSDQEKEKSKYIEDFSGVIKFRFEDNRLLIYLLWILLFALFTEVFGSGLYEVLRPFLISIYQFFFS